MIGDFLLDLAGFDFKVVMSGLFLGNQTLALECTVHILQSNWWCSVGMLVLRIEHRCCRSMFLLL